MKEIHRISNILQWNMKSEKMDGNFKWKTNGWKMNADITASTDVTVVLEKVFHIINEIIVE